MKTTKKEKIAATKKFNQKIASLKTQGKAYCRLCDKIKPLAEFGDDSRYCRICEKACQKAEQQHV